MSIWNCVLNLGRLQSGATTNAKLKHATTAHKLWISPLLAQNVVFCMNRTCKGKKVMLCCNLAVFYVICFTLNTTLKCTWSAVWGHEEFKKWRDMHIPAPARADYVPPTLTESSVKTVHQREKITGTRLMSGRQAVPLGRPSDRESSSSPMRQMQQHYWH